MTSSISSEQSSQDDAGDRQLSRSAPTNRSPIENPASTTPKSSENHSPQERSPNAKSTDHDPIGKTVADPSVEPGENGQTTGTTDPNKSSSTGRSASTGELTSTGESSDLFSFCEDEPGRLRGLDRRFDSLTPRWLKTWVCVAVVVTSVVLAIHLYSIVNQRHEFAKSDKLHRIVRNLNRIMLIATAAETGQRGYLITGEEDYLEPYIDSPKLILRELDNIERLTHDNPSMSQSVAELRQTVVRKFDELATGIDVRRDEGFELARELVNSDEGRHAMIRMRKMVQGMIKEEESQLTIQSSNLDFARDKILATAILIGLSSGVSIVTLGFFGRRHHRRIAQAQRVIATREETLNQNLVALGKAHAASEAANRSRGEFLANMSHEIRTPMTAIIGHANILMDHLENPDDIQTVQTIVQQGEFLIQIINDILDLSKIDAGAMTVRCEPLQPENVLADIESLMRVTAAEKDLAFKVRFEGKTPRVIQTDPIRLRQILINLIGNAFKFTQHGRIDVIASYQADQNQLRIAVKDTGQGFDPVKAEQMFRPFEQADNSHTRAVGGTGLGLTISRRLAHALGGEITATSVPGHGSTFVVSIDCGDVEQSDLVHAALHKKPPAQAIQKPKMKPGARVLVVDDRREIRFLVRHFIEKAGGEVHEATNGKEACDILMEAETTPQPFDAVVMDMQMPVLDGYQATRWLRRNGFVRPIIALTANAMVEDRVRCLDAGCNEFCTKPIVAATLVETVNRLLQTTPHVAPEPVA